MIKSSSLLKEFLNEYHELTVAGHVKAQFRVIIVSKGFCNQSFWGIIYYSDSRTTILMFTTTENLNRVHL